MATISGILKDNNGNVLQNVTLIVTAIQSGGSTPLLAETTASVGTDGAYSFTLVNGYFSVDIQYSDKKINLGTGIIETTTADNDLLSWLAVGGTPVDYAQSILDACLVAQTAAEAAQTGAETAETNANTSASNASTSETNASASATSAATSATNAASSATSASTSATNAATSATNASNSASSASTSATNASTSETNAATSASNAATSESNAATSASNAATSEANAATSATDAANSAASVSGLTTDINANTAHRNTTTGNPHGVTKADVGLGNVDNTADADKPISTATQTALDAKEPRFTKNTGFNKNLGTTAGTVSEGNHTHGGVYEPADATILKDADIGVTVQAYNANTTIQGNTFNGASQLVQLDASSKLPAVDGSQVTGISSSISGATDTTITAPADTEVLTYDAASSKWVNAAAGGGGGEWTLVSTVILAGGEASVIFDSSVIGSSKTLRLTVDTVPLASTLMYMVFSTDDGVSWNTGSNYGTQIFGGSSVFDENDFGFITLNNNYGAQAGEIVIHRFNDAAVSPFGSMNLVSTDFDTTYPVYEHTAFHTQTILGANAIKIYNGFTANGLGAGTIKLYVEA